MNRIPEAVKLLVETLLPRRPVKKPLLLGDVALSGYERYRKDHRVQFQKRAEYLARRAQASYPTLKRVRRHE